MSGKEHEIYGGEIPDEEGEMGIHNTDYEMPKGDYDAIKFKEAEEMRKRYQEEEMGSQQDADSLAAAQASKEEADARSVFVGNVDYACTPEEVQQLFQTCGTVNRVTILTDKFGQPKGFAYVEFQHPESVQDALQLNESELHGRQLKVLVKRTNVPGMKQQFRAQGFNPYGGGRFRRPYVTPYPSYGYGKMPRYRRPPMGYSPYAYY